MNIDSLLKKYFGGDETSPAIEVFDDKNIHRVYTDIVNILKSYPEILYLELHSNQEIDPNGVLENRADAESEFNDQFLNAEDIENLW